MSSPFSLKGKVVLVSGASRGIGEAIAGALAAAGARVGIASRKPEGLDAARERLAAVGHEVWARPCHMGKHEEVERMFHDAADHFGQIDAVVNNAATNPYFGPMLDVEQAAWDKTFEVNLEGYFYLTRALARHLEERDATGSVVNVASIMGRMGAPFQGVYGMSKAAVISMTQTLAVELGPRGVRVNSIAPGLINTRFAKALVENDAIRDPLVARTPLGRVGEPEDIGGAAAFLVSDAARFMTGHTMVIDGGLTVG